MHWVSFYKIGSCFDFLIKTSKWNDEKAFSVHQLCCDYFLEVVEPKMIIIYSPSWCSNRLRMKQNWRHVSHMCYFSSSFSCKPFKLDYFVMSIIAKTIMLFFTFFVLKGLWLYGLKRHLILVDVCKIYSNIGSTFNKTIYNVLVVKIWATEHYTCTLLYYNFALLVIRFHCWYIFWFHSCNNVRIQACITLILRSCIWYVWVS